MKERIQSFDETVDLWYIYHDEPDKICFQHDLTYRDFQDLPKRTASDKVLRFKAFIITKTSKYDRYRRDL